MVKLQSVWSEREEAREKGGIDSRLNHRKMDDEKTRTRTAKEN